MNANFMKSIQIRALYATLIILLSACGGGGGGGSGGGGGNGATAEGLYIGTTNTSRTVTGVILDDGTYWVIYSVPNNSDVIAGAIQGTGTSLNGSFSSSNGRDFNLEGDGINDATISASYRAKETVNGTVTYPSLNETVTFTSAFDAAYDQTPNLSIIAGTYSGSANTLDGTEFATAAITATGAISGSGVSGCSFVGSATPRTKGNIYDVTVTFGGGVCSNGTSTVIGIAYFDLSANRLYATALNNGRSNGFIYIGDKS